jgi:ATP synthase F1 gamma subunit
MATRKEVKNRISSVKNVQKITRAMEMVAAARLRRAEQRIDALRPYARELRKMTRQVAEAAGVEARNLPVLQEHEEQRTVGILLVTGDRGLAGSFNSQIIRAGVQLQRELSRVGQDVRFSVVGRRGASTMRFRGEELKGEYVGFTDRPAFSDARQIADELVASYVDQDLNRVDLIYNRYVSPLTQYVRRQTLLPVQQADVFGEGVEELTPATVGTGKRPYPSADRYASGPALAPAANERGWKDTIQAHPGMVTRILVPFGPHAAPGTPFGTGIDTPFTGGYVWHCHIIDHEDNEMMRPYEVVT